MSVYADVDEVKTTLQIGDDFADEDIEAQIETASRDVDDVCGQRFHTGTGEPEIRYFHGDPRVTSVRIGPIVEIEAVHADHLLDGTWGTEIELDIDYFLEPLNAVADGIPWQWLNLNGRGAITSFPICRPNIRVEGVFGWSEAPRKVKTATVMLANRYLKRTRDAPFAIIPGESTAMRIARQDPDVYKLLLRFMRGPLQA